MQLTIERALEAWCAAGKLCVGQIAIEKQADGFRISNRDDAGRADLTAVHDANDLAKFDDAGNYRPLKTAPTLRHGWRIKLEGVSELRRALDMFYPGRLAILLAVEQKKLRTTPLRETLDRQTGMYRIAAKISDDKIDEVVGNFCRSDGGCLRTILWKRDENGGVASSKLPPQKFDPAFDQTGRGEACLPLLCQEACNLLVNECRKVVKTEGATPSAP